jgi:predicted transposase YdaD
VELINIYLLTAVLTEAQEESMEQEILDQLLEIEETWGDKLREEGRKQGREEGREEGQLAGKRALILRMLTLMFGELPAEAISYINSITEDATFDQLTQRILAAQRLEDVIPQS